MKVLVLVVLAVSVCGEDAPYPPSGWKPQGALLVLPKYGPPPNDTASTTAQPIQDETDLDKVNESVMERLRQEHGSDTGVYYVYLPDGRLQKVQYTTAPLKKPNNFQQTSFQNTQQSNHQVVIGSHQTSTQSNGQKYPTFARVEVPDFSPYQTQYAQYKEEKEAEPSGDPGQILAKFTPQYTVKYVQENPVEFQRFNEEQQGEPGQLLAKFAKPQVQESSKIQEEASPSYVASVQFNDVPPISGPVYSYKQSPLVRIVRYAAEYQ